MPEWLKIVIAAVVGVGVSVTVWQKLKTQEHIAAERNFREQSVSRVVTIQDEIDSHLAAMHMLQDHYRTSGLVERDEFNTTARSLVRFFPSLTGMCYSQRIEHAERVAHEAKGLSEGLNGYQITEKSAEGELIKASDREVYYPFFYAVTDEQQAYWEILGFDPVSDGPRRDAINAAMRTCELSLPDIDGYEVCRQIRREYEKPPPNVAFWSANVTDDARLQAREAGGGTPSSPSLTTPSRLSKHCRSSLLSKALLART